MPFCILAYKGITHALDLIQRSEAGCNQPRCTSFSILYSCECLGGKTMAHHLGSTELILDLYLTVINFLVMFRDSKGEILPMIQARAFTQTTHPNISKGRYLHHHHPPWSGSFTSKAARNPQLGPSKKCWGRTNFSTIWVCNIIIPTNLK